MAIHSLKLIKQKINIYTAIFKSISCSSLVKYSTSGTKDLNFYIKGTCNLETSLINIDFGKTTDHIGWLKKANVLFYTYKQLFQKTLDEDKKIFILGGSLGAAVGSYLIDILLKNFPLKKQSIHGIFIASPKSVSINVNKRIQNNVLNILDYNDIITYVPYSVKYMIPGKIYCLRTKKFYKNFLLYKKSIEKLYIVPSLIPYHFVTNYNKVLQTH